MRYLCLVAALAFGCNNDTPRDDYRDYRERTEQARTAGCQSQGYSDGALADITGLWMIRALLNGGISLGLRIEISAQMGETNDPPRRIEANFWLEDQGMDMAPIATAEAEIDDQGRFVIIAEKLELGPDVLGSESSVEARVELHGQSVDSSAWCGTVFGSVVSPLTLNLDGSTFGALRYMEGIASMDVPFKCPGDPCAADATIPADVGVMGDTSIERPERPEVNVTDGQRHDLTGDWFLQATLSGIPLPLWIALNYRAATEPDGPASLDGVLRLARDPIDQPGRFTFSAEVNENGEFDIWLPGIDLAIGDVVVVGDVLLSAASFVDGWCGVAAGAVTQPFEIDLTGSTFGALRWEPGTEAPAEPLGQCP